MIQTKRFSTSKKGYGGNIYEVMVDRALEKSFDHEIISRPTRFKGFLRLLEAPSLFFSWFKFSKRTDAFLIRTYQMALFNYKKKGLTIIYHIDASHSPVLAWLFQKLIEVIFFFRHQVNEPIVVIAEYWKEYLAQRGYKNLHLIYCGYDLKDYQITDSDVEAFRKKHHLEGKKLIYIGNPQKKKGADICYEVLKDSPYTLVTSGVKDLDLPVLHLDLSFRDYICLLKASEVVLTMSQFKEGWNRVAHEAMLVGTPVIGSGMGGMREPLEGGKQIVCEDPKRLPQMIDQALRNRAEIVTSGKVYAEQFSVEKFECDWQILIKRLAADNE